MSAVQIVITKLLAASAVTAITSTRVYPILAPQTAITPQIVVHLIDNDDGAHLNGANKYYRSIVQVDSNVADSISGAAGKMLDLGETVIDVLNGVIKETVAGFKDVDIFLGDSDFTEYLNDRNAHSRVTRFSVQWRAAA